LTAFLSWNGMKYRDVFTISFACWFLHCVKAPVIFDQLGFVYEINSQANRDMKLKFLTCMCIDQTIALLWHRPYRVLIYRASKTRVLSHHKFKFPNYWKAFDWGVFRNTLLLYTICCYLCFDKVWSLRTLPLLNYFFIVPYCRHLICFSPQITGPLEPNLLNTA